MADTKDIAWRYAPLWATLFGAGATLLKKVGTHYIMKRKVTLEWSDVGFALLTAALSYGSFRKQYGGDDAVWYKR